MMDAKVEVEVKVDLSSLDSGESQAKVRKGHIHTEILRRASARDKKILCMHTDVHIEVDVQKEVWYLNEHRGPFLLLYVRRATRLTISSRACGPGAPRHARPLP